MIGLSCLNLINKYRNELIQLLFTQKFDGSECRCGHSKAAPIPYNPCCPGPGHKGHGGYQKYKVAFFTILPIIAIYTLYVMGGDEPHKKPCREYEFMRRRTKRFPWGDGNKSLYHNDHANNLPEECEPPKYCD